MPLYHYTTPELITLIRKAGALQSVDKLDPTQVSDYHGTGESTEEILRRQRVLAPNEEYKNYGVYLTPLGRNSGNHPLFKLPRLEIPEESIPQNSRLVYQHPKTGKRFRTPYTPEAVASALRLWTPEKIQEWLNVVAERTKQGKRAFPFAKLPQIISFSDIPLEKQSSTPLDTPITPSRLTKGEVLEYYQRPEVQQAMLAAVRNRDAAIIQSFNPETQVYRRYAPDKEPIRFTSVGDYRRWLGQRLSEVHPVFGAKEDILLADIDPGPAVPWARTKELAQLVAAHFASQPDVQKASVQFTGGRGFHIKGHLDQPIDVNEARRRSQEALAEILESHADTTLGPRRLPDQTRLDTTPLHRMGSTRAPYSLNTQTGLVAAPIDLAELLQLSRAHFKLGAAEFAPGIPASRETQPIPEVAEPTDWDLVVQQHNARRAGPHWDLRLVDPSTQHAHSFAIPKQRFPADLERMLLAIQTPTHTADYAFNYQGGIPRGTYGAGSVYKKLQEKVRILTSGPNKVLFERPDGARFTLFRTGGDKWGWRRMRPQQ